MPYALGVPRYGAAEGETGRTQLLNIIREQSLINQEK